MIFLTPLGEIVIRCALSAIVLAVGIWFVVMMLETAKIKKGNAEIKRLEAQIAASEARSKELELQITLSELKSGIIENDIDICKIRIALLNEFGIEI